MGLRDMYRAGDIIEYEGGGRDYLVSIEGEEGLWVNACNSTWIERGLRDFYRNSSPRSFHPTKAFLDKWVRGMYGWKNVKPSDVVIAKETCTEGIYYRVRKTVGNGDWFSVTSF